MTSKSDTYDPENDGGRTIRARFAFADGTFALVSKSAEPFRWHVEFPTGYRKFGVAFSIYDGFNQCQQAALFRPGSRDITLKAGMIAWDNGDYATIHQNGYIVRDRDENIVAVNDNLKEGGGANRINAAIIAHAAIRSPSVTPDEGILIGDDHTQAEHE